MLKLFRNLLAQVGIIYDGDELPIQWEYIRQLNEVQKLHGIHCANKLRDRHINFEKLKMKVCVATQTFSNSVANALLFFRDILKDNRFKNVGATVKFIKIIDETFDLLN